MSFEAFAETRPPAPCGFQKEHAHWVDVEGWPCPKCAAKAEHEQKEADENRLADKIAAALMRKIENADR